MAPTWCELCRVGTDLARSDGTVFSPNGKKVSYPAGSVVVPPKSGQIRDLRNNGYR